MRKLFGNRTLVVTGLLIAAFLLVAIFSIRNICHTSIAAEDSKKASPVKSGEMLWESLSRNFSTEAAY
jgi:hypothetical protein